MGTGQDTKLDLLIDRADELMAKHCGWPATAQAVHTMESASYVLYPPRWEAYPRALRHGLHWVGTITSAYVDEDWAYGASTQVTAGDMVIDNEEGVIWLKPSSTHAWSTEKRANKLTVVAGFTTTPDALVQICATVVRHLWDMGFSQGVAQVSHGTMSTSKDQKRDDDLLPLAAKEALSTYMFAGARCG